MKTTDEWMAETMQPIIDRIAGGPMAANTKLNFLNPSSNKWQRAADKATARGLRVGGGEWWAFIRSEIGVP